MKKIFQYAVAVFAGLMLFTACNVDNEGAIFSGDGGVSFISSTFSTSIPVADPTFRVPIVRGTAGAAQTVTISTGSDFTPALQAMFTPPATATFAAGELESYVEIGVDASLMTPGTNYGFTITTSDPSVGAKSSTRISCSVIPNWVPAGTGTFTFDPDAFFDEQKTMTLEQAEGSSFYRLPIFADGAYIQFSVDEDGIINVERQLAGFAYGSYGNVYVTATNGRSTKVGNLFSFYFTYTVSAGSFGEYGPETFELN